jgi:hypothetical protein
MFGNLVNDDFGTIGGGRYNVAGRHSIADPAAGGATVGGGLSNQASGAAATVGGGDGNSAAGELSTVPGGRANYALGPNSFAAGTFAYALHAGTFVWSDRTGAPTGFSSTADNQLLIRATGGVGIGTNVTTANALTVSPGQVIAGGTGLPYSSVESFVARGIGAGLSLDDRGNAATRWVIYVLNGALHFYRSGDKVSVNSDGSLTVGALGSAGATSLCQNASNQIASCSSSLRYKRNVAPLDLGLDIVERLHPIMFDWKDGGAHDLGFLAEDVDAISPLLTTRNAAGQVEGVKYDRLSAVLVNAIHEEQATIEAQATRIGELQGTAAAQASEIDDLRARLARLEQALASVPAAKQY